MAPTDRQPTESHLAAARSRMVSIQSSLHVRVGRHLFFGLRGMPAGAGLARAARLSLAYRRRPRMRRWAFLGYTASLAGVGLARVARLSLACRRRSGGAAGSIFFGLRGIAGRGGIGSRGSPFPCLPGASGGAAGGIFFGLRGIAGRGGIGSHCSPFPCLPAASGDASVGIFGMHSIIGRGGIGSRCSPFPCLPAASLQEPENAERLLFYFGVQLRVNPAALQNKKAATSSQLFRLLRRERDSNPRNLAVQRFSRPPQSTTLPSLRRQKYDGFSIPPNPPAKSTETVRGIPGPRPGPHRPNAP